MRRVRSERRWELARVKDPSGAAVEASGRLENLATGARPGLPDGQRGPLRIQGPRPWTLPGARFKERIRPQSIFLNLQSAAPVSRTIKLALAAPAFQVDVVGTTPLPGVDRSLEEIPAPVQAATERDIEQSGALDLSDFLNRRLNGVYLNEVQGNPVQPDLNYRGYTASPLLGTPQGSRSTWMACASTSRSATW